jgi:hypothetical protein
MNYLVYVTADGSFIKIIIKINVTSQDVTHQNIY